MNRFWKFVYRWGFPLVIGGAYWLFDSYVDFLSHSLKRPSTFHEAFLPALANMETWFRVSMTLVCVFGAKYFEQVMLRVERLEHQLFLNEYAVENTKAFAMLWTDASGRITKVNRYAAERLGYTKNELLTKTLGEITVGYNEELWKQVLDKLKKEGAITYSTKQVKKDGTLVDAVVYLQYLKVKTDQYQFAFVCDAYHCPIAHDFSEKAVCGRPTIPTLAQVLKS